MRKILITGADGFLGRHLIKQLLKEDVAIYAAVFPCAKIPDFFYDEKITLIPVDFLNYDNDLGLIPDDIDILYHLAWRGVSPELRNDFSIQSSNIAIALLVMEIAKENNIKKIIMPGSTTEYLHSASSLINKNTLPTPTNAYGAAKVAVRYLCSAYAKSNDLCFIYAIITGIYSEDRRDGNVIFYTIDSLLKNEKTSYTALTQKWDYVHVDDAIRALICIGKKGKADAVYAIGHGDNMPLYKYINIIRNIIDKNAVLGIGEKPYPDGEMVSSCMDLSDLINDTGFVPEIDFETGIAKVIDAVRKEGKGNA